MGDREPYTLAQYKRQKQKQRRAVAAGRQPRRVRVGVVQSPFSVDFTGVRACQTTIADSHSVALRILRPVVVFAPDKMQDLLTPAASRTNLKAALLP